jgi:hypothetical protein
MARRPRRRNKTPVTIGGFSEGELPSLTQLEQFSQQSLKKWRESAGALTELHTELFFGLELARQRYSAQLLEAIRANLTPGAPFQGWARIIDYRYSPFRHSLRCISPQSTPLLSVNDLEWIRARATAVCCLRFSRCALSHRLHMLD